MVFVVLVHAPSCLCVCRCSLVHKWMRKGICIPFSFATPSFETTSLAKPEAQNPASLSVQGAPGINPMPSAFLPFILQMWTTHSH